MSDASVQELARANLLTDDRSSPVFDVPEYMNKPQVYQNLHGHYIRIWRTKLESLSKKSRYLTYCAGLIEWTSHADGITLGLEWYYALNFKTCWQEYKYILHSHYPGDQPCKDLPDVNRSTTAEIKWQVKRLGELYAKRREK